MSQRLVLRFTGTWRSLADGDREWLVRRQPSVSESVRLAAAGIVDDVRRRGDAALRELACRYDGAALEQLEVPPAEMKRALCELDAGLRRALERAAANIASVHGAFRPQEQRAAPEPGITIVRRPDPLARVGIYAPGGRASYPSSVLMTAVPAKVAGVGEIILASPPDASGLPSRTVLAAAALAGVDRVFALGGAGAIAAMAYGTDSVPRVDRIAGPGNAYVAAAKLLVVDQVAIDCPAGPSELVAIADESTDARVIAAEMLAQAEHDPQALALALVVGQQYAEAVRDALSAALERAPRAYVARAALRCRGGVLEVSDAMEAVQAANALAPEHLLLATRDAAALVPLVCNAGSVFVGAQSSVAFGDYMTGGNHVLPTGGAARAYSGLSPLDFVRWTTFQTIAPAAAAALADDVATFAAAEGLPGHAAAALQWSRGSLERCP